MDDPYVLPDGSLWHPLEDYIEPSPVAAPFVPPQPGWLWREQFSLLNGVHPDNVEFHPSKLRDSPADTNIVLETEPTYQVDGASRVWHANTRDVSTYDSRAPISDRQAHFSTQGIPLSYQRHPEPIDLRFFQYVTAAAASYATNDTCLTDLHADALMNSIDLPPDCAPGAEYTRMRPLDSSSPAWIYGSHPQLYAVGREHSSGELVSRNLDECTAALKIDRYPAWRDYCQVLGHNAELVAVADSDAPKRSGTKKRRPTYNHVAVL